MEEEEEIIPKKKAKKVAAKGAERLLARIEMDDEPISAEDGYFFADVLDEQKSPKKQVEPIVSGELNQIPAEKSSSKELSEANDLSDSGFTIGQLLAKELSKNQANLSTDKERKKGAKK